MQSDLFAIPYFFMKMFFNDIGGVSHGSTRKMWVKSIYMFFSGTSMHTVKANLVIWDSDGNGTERAKVTTEWTLPNGSIQTKTGTTKSDGRAAVSIKSALTGT